jgi:hypothetical protein
VLADFGGYLSLGFRRAGLEEICGFLVPATGSPGCLGIHRPVATLRLLELIGTTSRDGSGFMGARGIHRNGFAEADFVERFPQPRDEVLSVQVVGYDPAANAAGTGHWLVRGVAAPEPAPWLCLVLGAVCALGRRGRG